MALKYKVGDRVRIKSLDWYNENKDKYGTIYTSNGFCFCDDMTKHCGDIMKIIDIIVDPKDSNQGYYIMDNVKKWTDEMIECKVGEETKPKMVNLDKACEWLKENIWVYINYEGCSGEELENDVIEDFRKAMEE